jgi:hypothetical protein
MSVVNSSGSNYYITPQETPLAPLNKSIRDLTVFIKYTEGDITALLNNFHTVITNHSMILSSESAFILLTTSSTRTLDAGAYYLYSNPIVDNPVTSIKVNHIVSYSHSSTSGFSDISLKDPLTLVTSRGSNGKFV